MTIKEIAKVCMTVARSLGLQESQTTTFATHIMRECVFGNSLLEASKPLDEPIPHESETPVQTITTPEQPKVTKKRIKKMKEAAQKYDKQILHKIICKEGTKCYCDVCGKAVYQVLSDIPDGLKAEEFAAKFMPIGHGKLIPVPTRIRAVDGCVMTDCPVCKSDMSLILWGKKPEKDFEDGDVGSAGNFN